MLGTLYRVFVASMVLALFGVFFYMDRSYRNQNPGQQEMANAEADQNPKQPSGNLSPDDNLEAVKHSRFAQRILDEFSEGTVVDAVEYVDPDQVLVRKEILLTEMKYPLIRREIHFQMDESTGNWVPVEGHAYVADQVMMALKDGESIEALDPILADLDAEIVQSFQGGNYFLLRFKSRDLDSVDEAISSLKLYSMVDYAEPNYLRLSTYVPNDSRFGEQWALENSGGSGGRPDADIDATDAWGVTLGERSVIVAVTDTGIDNHHPDLQNSIYRNPNEVLNGLDDDGNGYIDDVAGWNFSAEDLGNSNTQDYAVSHGTHVSGIIAAQGDNNQGVIGVAPGISLLPVKVLDEEGGFLSDFINGIDYAIAMGASIINVSLGGNDYSLTEKSAIDRAEENGVLVVVASGNESQDISINPEYPVGYDNGNILAVLSTNRLDQFEDFSSYSSSVVDIAAPGRQILSTYVGNDYRYFKGTSMSAAYVTGVAALVKSVNPTWQAAQLKEAVMNTVDKQPSLIGKCASEGRVNAYRAVCYATERVFFPSGSQIAIRSDANLKYVTCDPTLDHRLVANGSEMGDRQIFYSYQVTPGRYAFQSISSGLLVSAGSGGDEALIANQQAVSSWELFAPLLVSGSGDGTGSSPISGNRYAFRADANGKIVTVGNMGTGPLIANQDAIGEWETFTVEPVRPLPPGRMVVLQSAANGQFVSPNDSGQLMARDAVPGVPNIFTVGLTEDGYITLKSAMTGYYVSTDSEGSVPLMATGMEIGDEEKLIGLHYAYGALRQVLLRAKTNTKFVSMAGDRQLFANGEQPGAFEIFYLHLLP